MFFIYGEMRRIWVSFIPVYLESELHYLAQALFGDGTWSIFRNVEFGQYYVFA